jgi:O-antigen ligase
VGPDVVLHVHAKEGSYAYFAHDEYLQIAAGAGLVGELLLLAAAASIIAVVRRRDVLSSCAAGALVAFAVAAAFDFDWHLAALGLIGGWAAGLAAPPVDADVEPRGRALDAAP